MQDLLECRPATADAADSPSPAPTQPTASATGERLIPVRVARRLLAGQEIVSLELRTLDGSPLPAFTAGSHVEVHLPGAAGGSGLVRHYSLCNDPAEVDRYVLGIARAADSAGGSKHLHDQVGEGQELRIGAPRNNFALVESAAHSVFIAGGIGVTPLLAMARRLSALGRRWTFYYCVQRPERAAFLGDLHALGGTVVPVFDGMPGVRSLDLAAVAASAGEQDHLYCCGPQGLMRAFLDATKGRKAGTVHVEWFSAPTDAAPRVDAAFDVQLAKSQRLVHVQAGQSLLDALLAAGVNVAYSCSEGICGTCEARVLEGAVDHRDVVLSDDEKREGKILTCVSRAAGDRLVLDL
jgi:vanillate O-demethylase ferredoxin subunit